MSKAGALWMLVWLSSATALAQAPESSAAAPSTVQASEPAPDDGADETSSAEPGAPADDAEQVVPLSHEELEALGFAPAHGGGTAGLDTDLHVSGFLDFGVSKLIADEDSQIRAFLPNKTSFYIGNFNLYLSKNLSQSFRTMGEVRFLYMPNGDIPLNNGVGVPTTTTKDPADFDRTVHWGGIEIERAYLEWSPHSLVSVRAGQFLTPYGVWNVDHGSPTFIPVQRPYVVGEALFPERQTGFELFGRWDATRQGTLGYHLTLSNGQGPITEYRDLDENKAIGGRLFWEQQGLGSLRLGGSAYYGRSTDATTSAALTPSGMIRPVETVHLQYDDFSFALDAVWRYSGLLVQAEWISQQRVYTERGRVAIFNEFIQQTVLPVDTLAWGAYGLVGYRLPWFGVMPYYVVQYLDNMRPNGVRSEITNMQAGLNIRPLDALVFKLEYSYAFFARKLFGSDDPIQLFQAQAAWAF